jgi:FtsP/CotA-like multicopper oxidase with cupredoxin domain
MQRIKLIFLSFSRDNSLFASKSNGTWAPRLVGLLFFILCGSPVYALEAEITTAPHVPPFISRIMPETVVVKFEAKEFVGALADGQQYKFWSFNGTVPGPMIRVRLGDTVEFHLANHAGSQFPHNIDIHAVNGPGGGAAASLVAPGEEKIFRFKTLHPGLFVYHCASPIPSIPAHIANGMYGLILVEPKHGFPRVDHEFYVFESEFYTQNSETEDLSKPKIKPVTIGKVEEKIEPSSEEKKADTSIVEESTMETDEKEGFLDSLANTFFGNSPPEQDKNNAQEEPPSSDEPVDSMESQVSMETGSDESVDSPKPEKKYVLELSLEKGLREQADYVVFNGRQGALLGKNALRVKVGEKVRIFFGNIGPNGISSFHIIGEIFDQVHLEGAVNGIVNRNVQTTLVPSAGATIVEFIIDVPGDYLLVDHSIFRIDKGAIGLISATGDDKPEIFESVK